MSDVAWAIATFAGFAVAARAARTDVRERRIPNRDTAIIATLSLAGFVIAASELTLLGLTARVGLALGVLVGPLALLWVIAPAAIGAGDVKLAAALAPFAAWPTTTHLFVGLVAMFVTATPHALATRRTTGGVPFGPYIVTGIGIAAVLARVAS